MRGYTLLEIIIAVAIIILIAGIAFGGLKTYKTSSELAASAEDVLTSLGDARVQTLASRDASQYGVHFETGKIIFFKGTSYTSGNPDNKEIVFPASVEISTISLNGGGSEIIFKRLTGTTEQYGTVTLRLKNNPTKTRAITIEQNGAIHQ